MNIKDIKDTIKLSGIKQNIKFFVLTMLFVCCESKKKIDFNAEIKPIINKKCISCHGGVKKTAGFSLLFEKEALANTDEGSPAIIPGDSKNSRLIQRLHETDIELRMPYHKPKLSESEIELFTEWIDQGANWGTHWAYIPPKNEKIPELNTNIFSEKFFNNTIDKFIAVKMLEKNLSPNPESKKSILARKVSFDITGLPPNKKLFELFIENKIDYETYVDSLFSRDYYGEKWASWWLDLARYSDSKGYETDRGRNIWEYRDWVIKSLNKDLPFDEFTIQQIAGDLLPNSSYDQLLATAFHRNTMNNDEGGTNDEEYRVAAVIDRVNTTFDVWQSTTMGCVQCHDHPYDPIRHKEYYQLMSFFNNTRDEDLMGESPNLRSYSKKVITKINSVLEFISEKTDNQTLNIYRNFFKYLEPKYALHNSIVLNSENGFISGETLNLRNKGIAVYKNINTRGFENLYFKHGGGRKNTKLIFRKNSPDGKMIASINLNQNEPSIGIPSYSPIVPEGVKMFPEYLRKIGYYTSNNSKEDYNFKKTDGVWDDSSSNAHWKNRAADQPFFAVFNYGISHESQIWEQGSNDIFVDQKLVQIPPYFPDTYEIRKDIAVNYSNLIRLDKEIGKIIKELKQEGLYEKSIIFFYSDHGGPFPRHKRSLYETGIKVPLIIKFPYSKYGGTENNNFISFIDYAPSILSLVGIKPPDVMQGEAQFGEFKVNEKAPYIFAASDRFDEKVDRLRAVRYNNFKYIRNFNPKISNAIPVSYREQMPMMRELNKLWKENLLNRDHSLWFKTPKPKEELYDLNKDPYELRNLADEIRLKDTLFFLREVLDKWIIHTNDLGEYSEKELVEKWVKGEKSKKLKSISFKKEYGKIILEHFDSGSTILWKGDKDSIWNIYSKPISFSKSVIAKAVKIGYEDSNQITID